MEDKAENLTLEQEKFCQNYTQNTEFFGNATLSYADAYNFDIDSQSDGDAMLLLSDGREMTKIEYELIDTDEKPPKIKRTITESSKKRMYDNCSSAGSRLLRNVKIQKRCNELLNKLMENNIIDARLIKIILKGDDKDAIQAIREYNRLKQRILDKVDVTSDGKIIGGFNFIRNDGNNSNN